MPKLRSALALALFLLAGAAACTPRETVPGPSAASAGPLVSSLQVETSTDSVRFVLQVTNATAAPMALEFSSGQTFDFVVLDGERELWRWSADRMFTQALRSETLAAGETRTYEAAWRPPAGVRGRLVARGYLTARGLRAEQQSYFQLP